MSFLGSLFGKSNGEPEDGRGIEEHLEFLNTLRKPAIALSQSDGGNRSRIGGFPSLPEDVPWPEWNGNPLEFLCQLDLREIPEDCDRQGLPTSGMLLFFYNQKQETWGFDPKDRGSWRVIYASEAGEIRAVPHGLKRDHVYLEKPVTFTPVETYPDWQDERVATLELSDRQCDQYAELCSGVFEKGCAHHLFGYPSPVQGNDMDLECQLVSHGLHCGDASGYQDQRARQLEEGRHDWVLLLQLDTDDDVGMMWGDCGRLYFWIRKADLAKGSFDDCWMILQCS